jgi:hypothetical protein
MSDFIKDHAVEMDHGAFLQAVVDFRKLVDEAGPEHQLQEFLEVHSYIVSEQFAHCHHVFPRVRLGGEYEADFFCLECPSYGNEWVAIEIEPAQVQLVTKSGRRSAKLEHALQQVRDWRKWVTDNIDYARRSKDQNGLGLDDISPRFEAQVAIGRRADHTEAYDDIRRQISENERISVRSWDSVLDRAEQRAQIYADFHRKIRNKEWP